MLEANTVEMNTSRSGNVAQDIYFEKDRSYISSRKKLSVTLCVILLSALAGGATALLVAEILR